MVSTLDPTTPISSIRHRLASIVNRELEKMERGEIDELSTQHNDIFPRRVGPGTWYPHNTILKYYTE